MRLVIIPQDGSVGKDDKFYNELDLSSCNIPENIHALQWFDVKGWIEFKTLIDGTKPENQDITSLPDWTTCCISKWDEANIPTPPTPPTADENKLQASNFLYQTDWTTIPDVSDSTKSNPYLSNVEEFVVYRNAIRQYAIYPVAGYIDWPTQPQAQWTSVNKE